MLINSENGYFKIKYGIIKKVKSTTKKYISFKDYLFVLVSKINIYLYLYILY